MSSTASLVSKHSLHPEQSRVLAREAYARARARQSGGEKWVDGMVPMTDKVIGQEMAIVTATRNAIDVRKWVASRLMPNQYGINQLASPSTTRPM